MWGSGQACVAVQQLQQQYRMSTVGTVRPEEASAIQPCRNARKEVPSGASNKVGGGGGGMWGVGVWGARERHG